MLSVSDNIEEIDQEKWLELMDNSDTASFFQTKECYDFFSSLDCVDPFIFGVEENNDLKGVVVGYISKENNYIKQFFSRRAIIFGGPILAKNISKEAVQALLKICKERLQNRSIYIEFRNFNDYSRYIDEFEIAGFSYQAHYNYHIDSCLGLNNLSSSKRRQIRRSIDAGVKIKEADSEAEIKEFYKLLSNLYKTKIKKPIFPYEFFLEFYKKNLGVFLMVLYNGKVVGGIMCPIFQKKVLYEWFIVGKDSDYEKIYPSVMATWAAIKYANDNLIDRFDFMGAGKPDEEYGVREFKSKFGGVLVEHGRFVAVNRPYLYKAGKFGLKILKKLSG